MVACALVLAGAVPWRLFASLLASATAVPTGAVCGMKRPRAAPLTATHVVRQAGMPRPWRCASAGAVPSTTRRAFACLLALGLIVSLCPRLGAGSFVDV